MYHSGASANELTLKAKDDVYGRCRGRWLSVFHASALNVILRRYSLPEVPRRRIHNVIAYAMSICVAYSSAYYIVREVSKPHLLHQSFYALCIESSGNK